MNVQKSDETPDMTPPSATSEPRLDAPNYVHAAECLKILAHPHRLQVVHMLLNGRYSVGQLADACEIPSAMMSDHLRLMQRCGYLACEKDGRTKYYTIIEPHLADIISCLESRFSARS